MSHWLTLLTPTTMITIIIQGEWNDYYCAVCNDGGEIIACDGVCLRRSVTSLPFIVPVVSACRLGPVVFACRLGPVVFACRLGPVVFACRLGPVVFACRLGPRHSCDICTRGCVRQFSSALFEAV